MQESNFYCSKYEPHMVNLISIGFDLDHWKFIEFEMDMVLDGNQNDCFLDQNINRSIWAVSSIIKMIILQSIMILDSFFGVYLHFLRQTEDAHTHVTSVVEL